MKIDKFRFMLSVVVLQLVIGCSSRPVTDWRSNDNQLKSQINNIITNWEQRHNYHETMHALNALEQEYYWGVHREKLLAAVAIVQLEYGDNAAFLESSAVLKTMVKSWDYLGAQMQHILVVASAMDNCAPVSELPGSGYDHVQVEATYQLLGCDR